MPFFEASKCYSALGIRLLAFEDLDEVDKAASLFLREAGLLKGDGSNSDKALHQDFYPMVDTVSKAASRVTSDLYRLTDPLIRYLSDGPIGEEIKNGASVDRMMNALNIENPRLRDELESISLFNVAGKRVNSGELHWTDAAILYGIDLFGDAGQTMRFIDVGDWDD